MRPFVVVALLLAGPVFAQEGKLLATLKSDAPPQVKADACRDLARRGTRQAVPVLAPLLADEQLSDMARYALEPIADPSVDSALRAALARTKGRQLVGVIASLGVRKDAKAVGPLAMRLGDADPEVAQAAARALGSIGGSAVPVLAKALSTVSPANRAAVCEGLLRCAEAAPSARAAAVYDRLRAAKNLPGHVNLAALLGAIRSRGAQGVPLLLKTIRNESYAPAAGAMTISSGIPGVDLTRALVGELARVDHAKQLLLVQTLGRRGDISAVPALERLARTGAKDPRVAAIRALAQLGSPSSLPLLVGLLRDPDKGVSEAAHAGLVGYPGKGVDAMVAKALAGADAKSRIAITDVVLQRRIASAVPALLRAAGDPDAGVAGATFRALGELAGVAEIPVIVDAMMTTREVSAAEGALSAICARQPDTTACAGKLLAGLAKAQGEPKLALLRLLGGAGGASALAAVRAAAESGDPARETALHVLCDWPTADALPDLARIAKTTNEPTTRILALRGELRLVSQPAVADPQKLSYLAEALPLVTRKEEQIQALAVLGTLPSAGSLALIMPYLTGGAVQDEANLAAIAVADRIVASHPAEVVQAMGLVQTKDDQVRGRVAKLLSQVPQGAVEAGFTPLFNGKDLTGWDGKPGWWTVEEGALTAESTPAKPCTACNYLVWKGGQPADFELLAEFKLSVSANSGIQIRSETRPDWDTFGYQADMTGDGSLVGFVYHHSRGLIAGRGENATFAADGAKTVQAIGDPGDLLKHFRQGDWNTYRVICRGPEITLYVNGVLMCHITDHSATGATSRGTIALQMHPGPPMKVQFRNIRMRELK